jgi:hypothetical protein
MNTYLKIALALPALVLTTARAPAQSTISGRILDEFGSPVSFANVHLRLDVEGSLVRATVSDPRGNFAIDDVGAGAYRIHASRIGYRSASTEVITLSEGGAVRAVALVLQPETIVLEGIHVETRKAVYQQQPDRLVINVGSSATFSGTSALQVLERSPGVIVDRVSNSVSLIGKHGVRVLVNGRLSYIPADGLVQYLSGISAENLERVELITSPSVDLDAEGSGGYINLVMKRRQDSGTNGSLALSGGYGAGEIGTASASLEHRRARASLFSSYSFLWNAQAQFITGYRNMATAGGSVAMPSASWRDPVQRNHDLRIGIDYRATDRTTLGALVAGYDNRWSMHALSRLTIEKDGTPITRVDSNSEEVNHWRHGMANMSLRHELPGGSSIEADLDYLRYGNDNPTVYQNTSMDVHNGETAFERMESGKTTPLRILVARADYTNTIRQMRFGGGVKGAFSRFTNETRLDSPVDREWLPEAGFGSTSRLREDVLALYGSAEFAPRASTTLRTGFRYETTASRLGADKEQRIVDRRFSAFFPSLTVSHDLSDVHRFDASYTRRITRPSFRDMAPFLYFFDPQTFYSGNAGLQPAIMNTLKLDGTYRSVLASLQYAWEDSTIAQYQSRFLPEYQVHVMFPTNYQQARSASALLAAPVRVTPWWSTQNNAMLLRQEVDAVRAGERVSVAATSYRVNSVHNITLSRSYTLEGTGFYQSASLFGTMEFGAIWQVDAGLQRKLRSGATITLSLNDVFDSYAWRWTTGSPGDSLYVDQRFDSSHPSVALTYSTRLGRPTSASIRSTASAEENSRARQ